MKGRILLALLAALLLAADANARGRLFARLFPQPQPSCVIQPTPIPSRNMVNLVDRDLPTSWSLEEGKLKNIKWSTDLGYFSYGSPVVSGGKIYIATNGAKGIDKPRHQGVMSAYRESDGILLWRNLHPHAPEFVLSYGIRGAPSTPTVDGKSLYYVTPDGQIVGADADTGKIRWRFDLVKELKVYPSEGTFHTSPPLGAPLVFGDFVFVNTGNGLDFFDDLKFPSPNAPSFVALHKGTGKLAWQSNLPGDKVIEGQWSSPTCAIIDGVAQVIFPGGDGVIYSFEPQTGKLIWKCDCLPERNQDGKRVDNHFLAAPVVVGKRLYIGMGVIPEHAQPPSSSYFLCLDISKRGDVSLKSYDAKSPANKNSALVWAFGGPIVPPPAKGRHVLFHGTISTAAVHDGVVYVSEALGYLHCFDANTGQRYWTDDLKSSVFSSPYWADGKIYMLTQDGEMWIYAHGKTKRLIATISSDDVTFSTPVAANGVLYLPTRSKLHAITAR